jgi:hypothetical protein
MRPKVLCLSCDDPSCGVFNMSPEILLCELDSLMVYLVSVKQCADFGMVLQECPPA